MIGAPIFRLLSGITGINSIKIVLTSMFFSTKISHVVEGLEQRKDLREFLGIKEEEVPRTAYICAFLSRFRQLYSHDFKNPELDNQKRARNTRIIVDCTDVSVDVNWLRKPVKQKDLEGLQMGIFGEKNVCGYETDSGFGISISETSALLHPANRHEAKIFREVMNELKRRIIRKGDVIIMDKGFYAYRNYLIGMNEYRIVPLIFPRSFNLSRLDGMLSYPLDIFSSKSLKEEKRRFRNLKARLISLLRRWQTFRAVRSVIEDVFKLAKSFGLRKLHRYTRRSVLKFAAMNVLLVGIVVALGFREKKVLQRLAEM